MISLSSSILILERSTATGLSFSSSEASSWHIRVWAAANSLLIKVTSISSTPDLDFFFLVRLALSTGSGAVLEDAFILDVADTRMDFVTPTLIELGVDALTLTLLFIVLHVMVVAVVRVAYVG